MELTKLLLFNGSKISRLNTNCIQEFALKRRFRVEFYRDNIYLTF